MSTAGAAAEAVVKVRWARGAFTSAVMPAMEAAELTDTLRQEVLDCGDGTAFVSFVAVGGRAVHLRGRDVVSVEHIPVPIPGAVTPRAATGGVVTGVQITGDVVTGVQITGDEPHHADGTGFLRQQAARQATSVSGFQVGRS